MTSRITVAEMVLSGFGGIETTAPSRDQPMCLRYASKPAPIDKDQLVIYCVSPQQTVHLSTIDSSPTSASQFW